MLAAPHRPTKSILRAAAADGALVFESEYCRTRFLYYENGIMTVMDVQIPPEIKEAMEQARAESSAGGDDDGEGCDFDFNFDFESLIGEVKEAPFALVATDDMVAELGGDTFAALMAGHGMTYNEKTGKFPEITFTIEDDEEAYQIVMSFECVYSDENKSGVLAGGHITLTMVSGFIPGLVMVLNLSGEKPLT